MLMMLGGDFLGFNPLRKISKIGVLGIKFRISWLKDRHADHWQMMYQ